MPTTTPTTETTLYLKRTFESSRENVFKAWTEPDMLKQWCAPSSDFEVPVAEVDLKVGGKFRIAMKPKAQDAAHVAVGVYKEILPPEKLVFTWAWEGSEEQGETLVTVQLKEIGNATEVVLIHEFFPNKDMRDKHGEGWAGCLEMLARYLQS